MRTFTTLSLVALTTFALAVHTTGASEAKATAEAGAVIGQKAPAFSLPDTHGGTYKLADAVGKYVVLEWLNHDCPFVRKHYDSDNMQTLQKTYAAKDVVWLSICSSAPGKQGHYTAEGANKLTGNKGAAPTAVLLDSDGTVGRAYRAKVTPHIFIINPEGILIYQGAIDDIRSTKAADVKDATNYVRSTLDAAMAGDPVPRTSTKAYGCSVKY